MTGRALAGATGWHFTRISKIENGAQSPTDKDIRTWCSSCSAVDQIEDLIAQARAVESMYVEFKRQTRAGMKQFMLTPVPLYERTERFRICEHHVIPGLFQTVGYVRAMLPFWFGFLETRNDIDEAYLTTRRLESVDDSEPRYELGAIGHGVDGQQTADRFCAQIRAWGDNRNGRPQITVYRAGTRDSEMVRGHVIDKTESRLVFGYTTTRD